MLYVRRKTDRLREPPFAIASLQEGQFQMGKRKPLGFRREDAYFGGRPEGSLGALALAHGNFEVAEDQRATVGKEGDIVRQHSILKLQNQTHVFGLFSAYGGSSAGVQTRG